MFTHATLRGMAAFLAGAALLAFSGWALADPPSRVARLGYASGAVSFSPAGESDWVQATLNRPLGTGDRLWSDARARAEIQVGGAMIRMSGGTGLTVLNLDDRITQLELTQGTLIVRLRRLESGQDFEVDTPNLAFILRQPGEYRIDVDPDSDATTIVARQGQGEVYGDNASYVIEARQTYRFTGTDLSEPRWVESPRLDEFDRWAGDRDRAFNTSVSARYVSQDVVGYQDLDAHGTWRNDANYGNVWVPSRVPAGWAPFRDGHWAWIDPWGWTWVDDAPWGFAVSHYGRWANLGGTWGWVPGPVRTPAYYAPALVVFVGGANFQLTISSGNVGGVAWFPLAPREVYRPSYPVSRGYFENINRSNTVINNTVVTNVYNNVNVTNIVYANRQVAGAVVAVPTSAFVQSQPVSKAAVRVSPDMIVSRPLVVAPPVAPTEKSVHGAATQGDKPPPRAFERPVVARAAPPAAHPGFAAQQPKLSAKPGTPLDEAERKDLRPAAVAASQAPTVKVLAQTQTPPRVLAAPPAASGARATGEDAKPDPRAAAPTTDAASSPAPAAPRAARTPEPRAADQPGKAEERAPRAAAPQAPSAPAAAQEPRPRAMPGPASAARPAQARGPASAPATSPAMPEPAPKADQRARGPRPAASERPDQPGKSEERAPRVAAPQAPPAPPALEPRPRAMPGPASAARPAEPRGPASAPTASPRRPAASEPADRGTNREPRKQDEEDGKPGKPRG